MAALSMLYNSKFISLWRSAFNELDYWVSKFIFEKISNFYFIFLTGYPSFSSDRNGYIGQIHH